MDSAKENSETSMSSLSAMSTRVDENKPPNSGNIVESDKKQVTTPDPRWPYLNRWSSNPGIDVPTQAATELAPPHPRIVTTVDGDSCAAPLEAGSGSELVSPHPPDVPTVEVGSNASLIENAEVVTADSTILATPAISDKEKAELSSVGSPPLPPELNVVVEKPSDRAIDPAIEQERMEKEPVFIKPLGAWAKPLHFSTSPTPPEPATPKLGISEDVKSQIASFWPSIGEATKSGHKHMKGKMMFPEKIISNLPVEKIPPPVFKDDGSLRFPWAARMNQSARNLFRAAEPTYRLDGTPQVIETFQLKISENQLMSRCTKCNGKFIQKPLTIEEAIEAAKGFQRIPNCLFNKNLEFWQCMNCHQLYWEGTQYHNAVQKFLDVCKLSD